jgi:hypothetical protein
MRVVLSQPMFVPWIGIFEQVKLADVFVHYNDVKRPGGGSFMTRVQIKTSQGTQWLSAPIDKQRSDWLISETILVADSDWRASHLEFIKQSYRHAQHFALMAELADEIYAYPGDDLAGFNQHGIELIANWLELDTRFAVSSDLPTSGASSQRVIDICKHFDASEYVTGHGALNYLDHKLFEANEIGVSYVNYDLNPYTQLHGEFTPYVSILDAIANTGHETAALLTSTCVGWRDFAAMQDA